MQYSIVVHPFTLIEEIRNIKQELKRRIGWYPSVNSLAHFTISQFKCDSTTLQEIQKRVRDRILNWEIREILLDGFGFFENSKTLYIRPEKHSCLYLEQLFAAVGEQVRAVVAEAYICPHPHLSIGRSLKSEQMAIANRLFNNYSGNFVCEGVMFREFNPERKQYDLKEFIRF